MGFSQKVNQFVSRYGGQISKQSNQLNRLLFRLNIKTKSSEDARGSFFYNFRRARTGGLMGIGVTICGGTAGYFLLNEYSSQDSPENGPARSIHKDYAFEDPNEFKEWTLLSRESVCMDSAIFTFLRRERKRLLPSVSETSAADILKEIVYSGSQVFPPSNLKLLDTNQILDTLYDSAIWSVEIKQPQLQVAREYTPLPPLPPLVADQHTIPSNEISHQEERTEETNDVYVRLLIRDYSNTGGEVSRYVHQLPTGSKVYLRGPRIEAVLPFASDLPGRVLFLAAGTGIAPAIQLATAIWRKSQKMDERSGPSGSAQLEPFDILWSTRTGAECSNGLFPQSSKTGSFWNLLRVPPHQTDMRSLDDTGTAYSSNPLTMRLQKLQLVFPSLSVFTFPSSGGITGSRRVCIDDIIQYVKPNIPGRHTALICGPDRYLAYIAGSGSPFHPSRRFCFPNGGGFRPISTFPTKEDLNRMRQYDHLGRELPLRIKTVLAIGSFEGEDKMNLSGWFLGKLGS